MTQIEALEPIRELGTPETFAAKGTQGATNAARPRVNSHIHLPPNFSAFESVEQAIGLAREQGIGVLGVSNYYDYEVYNDFAVRARRAGIFPLYGLEIIALDEDLAARGIKINDPGNPGKQYICGKGITRFGAAMTARGQAILDEIRRRDSTRMAALIEKLEGAFAAQGLATGLDEARVVEMIVRRHGSKRETVYLQERHACQAFQESFFDHVPAVQRAEKLALLFGGPVSLAADDAVGAQNAIRANLLKKGKSAYVEETFITPQQARALILEMGGIPCYPTLADGVKPICPYEEDKEKLVNALKADGIYCAELIPIRNSPEVLLEYVEAIRAAGIVITAGTEHNTLDLLPIEPLCVASAPIPEKARAIFWEGACVVAAHQFLTMNGQVGYVDARGELNTKYQDNETRIRELAALGASLIEAYGAGRAAGKAAK